MSSLEASGLSLNIKEGGVCIFGSLSLCLAPWCNFLFLIIMEVLFFLLVKTIKHVCSELYLLGYIKEWDFFFLAISLTDCLWYASQSGLMLRIHWVGTKFYIELFPLTTPILEWHARRSGFESGKSTPLTIALCCYSHSAFLWLVFALYSFFHS